MSKIHNFAFRCNDKSTMRTDSCQPEDPKCPSKSPDTLRNDSAGLFPSASSPSFLLHYQLQAGL